MLGPAAKWRLSTQPASHCVGTLTASFTREVQEISTKFDALRLSRTDAAMLCGHAWAGAAHPGPAAVLCGQPVIAAHMLSADDW